MEGYLTHMFKITTQRSVESTNTMWKVQNTVAGQHWRSQDFIIGGANLTGGTLPPESRRDQLTRLDSGADARSEKLFLV